MKVSAWMREAEKNIQTLKDLGYQNLHMASAEDFKLDLKFDTILAGEVIEHLSSPGLFMKCAKEHLKDGGRLIITTPQPFALITIAYALFKYPQTCVNFEHTCWFCPQRLKALSKRLGFQIIHWDLIEDYRSEVTAPLYRLFMRLLSLSRFIMPKIFRCNAILFVLE